MFKKKEISETWDIVNKCRLFRICGGNHLSFRCRKQVRCNANGCGRKHNSLLRSVINRNDSVVFITLKTSQVVDLTFQRDVSAVRFNK